MIITAGALMGCIDTWMAGGRRLGMILDPKDPFYTSGVYAKGTTMTFGGIVVAQAGNVLACRTSKASIFKTSLRSDKWIWLGMTAQVAKIFFLVYNPLMQGFFGTAPLWMVDWAFLALMACIVVLAEEIRKWVSRKLSK